MINMRSWLLAVAVVALALSVANAQTPGCVGNSPCTSTQVFTPSGQTTMAVTTVSARVVFPSTGSGVNLVVTNTASTVAYLALGNSSVVATTTGNPIQPGQTLVFPQGTNTYLAAVTAAGTGSLLVPSGTGVPGVTTGGSSSSGGGGGGTSIVYSPLDVYAVTVGSTPVNAVVGPAGGCNLISTVDLIINPVAAAGTSASTTSVLLPAGINYQCGPIAAGVNISINCSGGGTCSWTGVKW